MESVTEETGARASCEHSDPQNQYRINRAALRFHLSQFIFPIVHIVSCTCGLATRSTEVMLTWYEIVNVNLDAP